MREIKFRAWDKENQCIVDGFTLNSKGRIDRDWYTNLMQYTGLKDKNGKEIYEGDIAHTNSKYKNKTDWTGIVKWSNEHCGFIVELENGKHWMPISEAEVIGNIYENPELLK